MTELAELNDIFLIALEEAKSQLPSVDDYFPSKLLISIRVDGFMAESMSREFPVFESPYVANTVLFEFEKNRNLLGEEEWAFVEAMG